MSGWGFLFLITAVVIVTTTPLRDVEPITNGLVKCADVLVVLFLVWAYLYWLAASLAPTTRFTQRIRIFERQSTPGRFGLSRENVILSLDTSGKLARTFFRVITRRWLNLGIRPDLASDVLALTQSIMLAVPAGGPDALRLRPDTMVRYQLFLKDVAGLLIIQRLDMVPSLVRQNSDLLRHHDSDDSAMSLYLHPMARRSPIEAFTEFAVPVAAIVLSTVALIVSAIK